MLTGIFSTFQIPFIMPTTVGLMEEPQNIISVLIGSVVYFLIRNVNENKALFTLVASEGSHVSVITLIVSQILTNVEMYIYIIAFVVSSIMVYVIRRSGINHCQGVAVVVGGLIQMLIIGGGKIWLGSTTSFAVVVIGCLISMGICFLLSVMILSLDYSRAEKLVFEDDEYCYYVKAVPKISVAAQNMQVTTINPKEEKKEEPEEEFDWDKIPELDFEKAKEKKQKE